MNPYELARLEAKTAQQQFNHILQHDFKLAPKIAQVIVQEAEQYLSNSQAPLKVGQIRVVLAQRHTKTAQSVADMNTVEVTWTLDAGPEDLEVLHHHGPQKLRQVRPQRLLVEALDQGAVATQEDLARVLNVTVRTIKRDFAELHAQGLYLPSRGYLHGVGRGQTHKARIISHWLEGQTYDQIAFATHHALISIQRYILTFVRVVHLHQQQFEVVQIAQLVQIGQPLVREYLALYQAIDSPAVQARLQEQIDRLIQFEQKGGPMNRSIYAGLQQRTFRQALIHLLETDYGILGSGRVLHLLADDVQALVDQFYPVPDYLKPGWMLFTGVKAEGPKLPPDQAAGRTLVTIAWPVLTPEDIDFLATAPESKPHRDTWFQQRLVRLVEYGWAHPQGPVLLTVTDLAAMLGLSAYEQGFDELEVAQRTGHTSDSVGHYLRDYERVKVLLERHWSAEEIPRVTNLRLSVVKAYVELAYHYHPELVGKCKSKSFI